LLHLETPKPNDDFVGFHTVWNDDSSPTFEGQTGKVKASRWSFRDSTTPKGIEIGRDDEIMKFIKNICEAAGGECIKWWNEVDNKYNTIEDFIDAFNEAKPFEGVWINWCIGGRQYTKNNGYKGWDLHLPKFSKDGVPFEAVDSVKSRILTFNKEDHTEIVEPKQVQDFGNDDLGDAPGDLPPMAADADFQL
jgi:hypothetical protein